MNERIWNRSLLLTAIGVGIVSSVSVWLAWNTSSSLAARLSPLALAPVLGAAITSYSLRTLRFHYFISRSGIAISLKSTAIVQTVGFALSVTPGHVGEVFKLLLIRERAGTPVIQTAPLLLLDRLTEGGGFLLLAGASALMLPRLRERLPAPTLVLLGLFAMLAFALTFRRWSSWVRIGETRVGRSRLWQRIAPHFQHLGQGLETSFTITQILGGLALSTLARFADGFVVLLAADMVGVQLALPEAVFVLAVSGLAGGFSFLPGGTGAVETVMVGLLVLLGATWANALAITLLARLCTLWLWVAVGLALAFASRLSWPRQRIFGR